MPLNPILPIVDLVAPYIPASLADPLYTIATADLASLAQHPTQIFPLLLSLFAAYWAWLSFLSSARFAFRTTLALAKWGAIAAVVGAIWMGYNGAGTAKGVTGGLSDAARIYSTVGKGVYSLGRGGVGYYLGSRGAGNSNSKRSASGRPRTWSKPVSGGGWDSPADEGRDTQAEEYVGNVLKKAQEVFFEYLAPPQEQVKRSAKKGKNSLPDFGRPSGLGGIAYDVAMGKAKKAWDEFADGNDAARKKEKKTSSFW
ncbi:hypothetical protein JCM10213_005027 [Rhodosporidiobolus nylandii]